MTAALGESLLNWWQCDKYQKIYPASEDNAAAENPKSPKIPAKNMTSQTAFTGVCVYEFICFQNLEPGNALSLEKANTTREASTPCAAPVTNSFHLSTFKRPADHSGLTCTTIIKLQIANIPLLPRTSRNSWAIGKGKVVVSRPATEEVAKDAAIKINQPNDAVPATPRMIAIGADLAAPADSSLMCAAESSITFRDDIHEWKIAQTLTSCKSPHWSRKS